jgi:hypothetical protein
VEENSRAGARTIPVVGAGPLSYLSTFRAKCLTREQVMAGYRMLLTNVDSKRLEVWAAYAMETEPEAKTKLRASYYQMGKEYDRLAADFEAWQAENPAEEAVEE